MRHRPNLLLYSGVIVTGFLLGWGAVEVAHAFGLSVGVVAFFIGGGVQLSEDIRRAKARRIQRAWEMCGYNLTTAARTCEMDISDFHRMVFDAGRKCDLWRLEMLGPEFISTLALLDLQAYGLSRFARTAVEVAPFLAKEWA